MNIKPKHITSILCVIFFLSGTSALIFEFLWFQLAGITFGNSVLATSLVLSAFMGGLAAGSAWVAAKGHKIKAPIRLYAIIELIIAASGFLLVILLPDLTKLFIPIYRDLMDTPVILNLFRGLTAFVLLLIPAGAMGATLPLLVKALHANNPGFGRVLGILYGWNTLGAMAGVILGEMFLIKRFGLTGTGMVAVFCNVAAALAATFLYEAYKKTTNNTRSMANIPPGNESKDDAPMDTAPNETETGGMATKRYLAAGFLSGFALLALEVIWFRFLLLFFNATAWNFAVMLATVLGGISLGGLAASRWFKLKENAQRFLIPIITLNGILIVLLYSNFGTIYKLLEGIDNHYRLIWVSIFLMFPVSFVSGIIFTMLGKVLHTEMKSETKSVGLLTLANTIGGMTGSLVGGLVLIPGLGLENSFFLLALCYGLNALLIYRKKTPAEKTTAENSSETNPPRKTSGLRKRLTLNSASAGTLLICLLIFPFGFMNHHYLTIPYERFNSSGERRVSVREGLTETIQYLQRDILGRPYYHRLITNGHSMSGTWVAPRRYMKMFVYLPAAVHPRMKNALLICFGCGMTAKALTDTRSLENIDIVDISRDIVEESRVVYPDPKTNPIYDPRVNIHIEDGRFFLLATTQHYDLITAEPPPPKHSGIVNLYTREYFQLIHDKLADGGFCTYWLPVYQLSVPEARSILNSFCSVFKDCSLWSGSGLEWMMVGVKNPGQPVDDAFFRRQWQDPRVARELRTLGFISPEQMGAFFIADGQRLKQWIGDSLPLVDNYPQRLESISENLPVKDFVDFMNAPEAQRNFMTSSGIEKIWPSDLRDKAKPFFPTAPIINELLTHRSIWKGYTDVMLFHRCMQDPLLSEYIPWLLDSDRDAQRIIASYVKNNPGKSFENPSTLKHLAGLFLQQRNFPVADRYLKMIMDFHARKDVFVNYTMFKFCAFRMYLAVLSGDAAKAETLGADYLKLLESRKGKAAAGEMRNKIEDYLKWLREISVNN